MKNKPDMSQVVLPFVHLNGTSVEELIRVRSEVYDAITTALDTLKEMAPNGRDYYPEPGRMEKAVEQHRRRGLVLKQLQDELNHEIGELEELKRK